MIEANDGEEIWSISAFPPFYVKHQTVVINELRNKRETDMIECNE